MQTHLITRAVAALIIVLGLAFASTGASAAGKGEVCGGFIGIPCDKGLWCQNPRGAMQGGRRTGQVRRDSESLPAHLPAGLRLRRQNLRQ